MFEALSFTVSLKEQIPGGTVVFLLYALYT